MFVVIKDVFCRDNVVFVAKQVFVVTNICRRVCRDNQTFTATKDVFCRNKHVFVARKKEKRKKRKILVAAHASDTPQGYTKDSKVVAVVSAPAHWPLYPATGTRSTRLTPTHTFCTALWWAVPTPRTTTPTGDKTTS